MPTLSAASVSAATCSGDEAPPQPDTGASTASVLLLLEGPLGLLLLLLDGPVVLVRGLVAALLTRLLLLALLLLLWSSGGRGGWDVYVWKIFCSGKHFLHQPSYSTHKEWGNPPPTWIKHSQFDFLFDFLLSAEPHGPACIVVCACTHLIIVCACLCAVLYCKLIKST